MEYQGVKIIDKTMDETGRFKVSKDYYKDATPTLGDIVKLKHPINEDEKSARFILSEDENTMGRVQITLICALPYAPIELVEKDEIEMAFDF